MCVLILTVDCYRDALYSCVILAAANQAWVTAAAFQGSKPKPLLLHNR